MKKFLAILLTLSMVFAFAACGDSKNDPTDNPANNSSNTNNDGENSSENNSANKEQDIYDENYVTPAEDFEWKSVEGGIEITAYNGNNKRVVVPETINNKKVVSLSKYPSSPFDGNILIEELVLPKAIINFRILGCDNLRYLEMRAEELGDAYNTDFVGGGWSIPETVEELVLPNVTVFNGDKQRVLGFCIIPENSKLTKLIMPKATGFSLSDRAKNIKEIVCAENVSYIRYILSEEGMVSSPFFCPDDDDVRGHNQAVADYGEMFIYDPWEDILICPIFGVDSITINDVTYSK